MSECCGESAGSFSFCCACLPPWPRSPGSMFRKRRQSIEMLALLAIGCLTAFLVAALGDAWDNVKHLFLFNLLLDAYLIFATGLITSGKSKDSPSSNAAP